MSYCSFARAGAAPNSGQEAASHARCPRVARACIRSARRGTTVGTTRLKASYLRAFHSTPHSIAPSSRSTSDQRRRNTRERRSGASRRPQRARACGRSPPAKGADADGRAQRQARQSASRQASGVAELARWERLAASVETVASERHSLGRCRRVAGAGEGPAFVLFRNDDQAGGRTCRAMRAEPSRAMGLAQAWRET